MAVISVYTYGVKIIKKFRWESGFLWEDSMEHPPLWTNGSAGYLMQLSVKPPTISTSPNLISKKKKKVENQPTLSLKSIFLLPLCKIGTLFFSFRSIFT